MKRPTLRALAKSRGFRKTGLSRERIPDGVWWMAQTVETGADGIEICAPTRDAAQAGLRAALLALPEVKKERKR